MSAKDRDALAGCLFVVVFFLLFAVLFGVGFAIGQRLVS